MDAIMLPDPIAWRLTLSTPEGSAPLPAAAALLKALALHAQDGSLTLLEIIPGRRSSSLILQSSAVAFTRITRCWSGGLLRTLDSAQIQQVEPLFTSDYCAALHQAPKPRCPSRARDNFVDAYGSRCQQAVRKAIKTYGNASYLPPEEDIVSAVWQGLLGKLNQRLLDRYNPARGEQVGWLFTIMYMLALSSLRHAVLHGALPVAPDADPEGLGDPEVIEEGLDEALEDELRRLLELYSESYPKHLTFFRADVLCDEPLPIKDLAAQLKMSMPVAYAERCRARTRLRRLLEKHGERFPLLKGLLARLLARQAKRPKS